MKLSPTQRTVLSEVDWRGPDAGFQVNSTYVKTIHSLVRRGLITADLAEDKLTWRTNITGEGLYVLRETMVS